MDEKQKASDLFKTVFGTAEGKEVLKLIMEYCGVGSPLWAVDQLQENANVSRHDVGVWIREQAKREE